MKARAKQILFPVAVASLLAALGDDELAEAVGRGNLIAGALEPATAARGAPDG